MGSLWRHFPGSIKLNGTGGRRVEHVQGGASIATGLQLTSVAVEEVGRVGTEPLCHSLLAPHHILLCVCCFHFMWSQIESHLAL